MIVYIQIGTNTGDDNFLIRVRRERPDLVILIEPNKDWNNIIRKNYKGVPNLIVQNVAITEKSQEIVTLYIPKTDKNGIAINGVGYGTNNFSILPMDDWGEELVELKVPGVSFSDLCDKYAIRTINFLSIDTEGYDGEIIKSIDFSKYNIKEIEYETWDFPEDCFKRHGDKKKDYGVNGTTIINQVLTQAGYRIEKSPTDSMNRVAKKI